MRCLQIKKDGKRCNAQAIKGQNHCFMHAPNLQKQRQLAQRKGGLARKHKQSYISQEIKLRTPKDVQKLIEVSLNSLLRGKMPSNSPASQVAYLANTWLAAYEKGEMAERLDDLERLVKKVVNENKH